MNGKIMEDKMKIAVTYDSGNVFQHFGHAEELKIYEVEDKIVTSTTVIATEGSGHFAMADFMKKENVDVIICGGIGVGAQNALEEKGIELISGVSGDADLAVDAFLRGELESEGVNCNHHGSCHSDDEEGCNCGDSGNSCGSCGGCHSKSSIEGKNVGKTCLTHYEGTFNDGTVFDSSYDRGEPLEFVCGAGMMISGYDKAVANMEIGEIINIHLEPGEAYGDKDPNAIFTIDIEQLPGAEDLSVGVQVYLQNAFGQPFPVTVADKTDSTITFDANHEMAGKELNFKIELVDVIE